jgi:hypothetical protein
MMSFPVSGSTVTKYMGGGSSVCENTGKPAASSNPVKKNFVYILCQCFIRYEINYLGMPSKDNASRLKLTYGF